LPAILAGPIARDLGLSPSWVFGAFSGALVVTAILGPRIGAAIDAIGGRGVLLASNLVLAAGLASLGFVTGTAGLFASWTVIGIGMAAGLYDPAFATLTRLYGSEARRPITGITLIAGFASTVGWPLTAYLEARYGWRIACSVWAGAHLAIGLPLNALLPRAERPAPPVAGTPPAEPATAGWSRAMVLVALMFAATGFVSSAVSAHLPGLLQGAGASVAASVWAGALVGPAQVGARLIEAGPMRHVRPIVSARIATAMHPLGVLALALVGPVAAPAFALLYGAGNGVITIVKGTLPLAVFGPAGYGRRLGLLAAPARLVQAAAPLAFGLMLEGLGSGALWISAGLSLLALAALAGVRQSDER
jgi:MFS family permease